MNKFQTAVAAVATVATLAGAPNIHAQTQQTKQTKQEIAQTLAMNTSDKIWEAVLQECEQARGVKIPSEWRRQSANALCHLGNDKELVISTLQDIYKENEVEVEDKDEVALVYMVKIANENLDNLQVKTRNKGDWLQAYRILWEKSKDELNQSKDELNQWKEELANLLRKREDVIIEEYSNYSKEKQASSQSTFVWEYRKRLTEYKDDVDKYQKRNKTTYIISDKMKTILKNEGIL